MYAIGFDIGGTAVKAGRLLEGKRVDLVIERPTPAREEAEATVEVLASMLGELESGAGGSAYAYGVGCAGLITPETGVVRASPNLPAWRDAPLGDLIRRRCGIRAVVVNDANAFALAESRLGAGRGAMDMIGLTLGTGVGGGIILGGRIWTGRHGFAGELGHFPILVDGPLCACGARGCLEAMIGTPAIQRRYVEVAGLPAEDAPLWTPLRVSAEARRGNGKALRALEETGRLLGLALAGLAHLLDPDLFIIGGGVAGSADLILPSARSAMAGAVMLPPDLTPPILPASLGNSAGWIGAALAGLDPRGA